MQADTGFGQTKRFDGAIHNHLTAVNGKAGFGNSLGNIA